MSITMPTQPITERELRIGNWVQRTNSKGTSYLKVAGLLEEFAYVLKSDGRKVLAKYGRIQGIPLTSEILEKCGFENDSYSNFRKSIGKENWLCVSFKDYACKEYSGTDFSDVDVADTLYLHQLQNLYFALTGQELTPNK